MTNAKSESFYRSLSVVVPVYNSEATLIELTARINAVLTPLVRYFEMILVNDGSRDRTAQKVKEAAQKYP